MPLLFVYRSLKDIGLDEKLLGHKITIVSSEAKLPGFREENEGKDYHTVIPDSNAITIGTLISVDENDIKALDQWEERYTRIECPLDGGVMAFTYVMKPMEIREESFNDDDLTPPDKEEFLATAMKRFNYCRDETDYIRVEALKDLEYKLGYQWSEGAIRSRERDSRPAQTVNRLASFVNMVVNDGLQNVPGVKVRAADDGGDNNTAQVIGGLIQHIITNGDSKSAFDRAYSDAVSCGLGYFRVQTDYLNGKSFDQEIQISMIENPFSVYFPIPIIKKPDYSDAPYCFIRSKMSVDEFDLKYPKFKGKATEFFGGGTGDRDWISEKEVFVCEYFVVDNEESTIYLMPDGKIYNEVPEGITPLRERTVYKKVVKWYLITQFEILDQKKWIGESIPIIPVLGQEQNVDGKQYLVSLTRALRQPQEMLNFWISAFTELVASQPKAPFLVDGRQIEDYKDYWENANKVPMAYLPYKGVTQDGQLIQPPIKINPPDPGTAILQGIQYAEQFMKEVTGVFDAAMGAQSNERSGTAINARKRQSLVATYHFVNNYNRAMRYLGQMLIGIIPKIYDMPRTIRIIGEDQADRVVQINQEHQDTSGAIMLYDIDVGKYDCIITIGASYDSKRLETVDMMMSLFKTNPQLTIICGDILAKKMDFDDNNRMSERIRNFINATSPGVIGADEQGTPEQQLHMQLQNVTQDLQKFMQKSQMDDMQKQQMMQMIQTMDKQLKDKEEEIKARVQVTQIKADTDLQKASIDLQKQREMMANDTRKHLIDANMKIRPGTDNSVE